MILINVTMMQFKASLPINPGINTNEPSEVKIDDAIVIILREGPKTLSEISKQLPNIIDIKCPDDVARALSRLRRKKIVKSKYSEELSTLIFWIE